MRIAPFLLTLAVLALPSCGSDGTTRPDATDCACDAALPPDAPTPDTAPAGDKCAEPGSVGNDKGVGKYCTKGGNECSGNGSATLCTVDFDATRPSFCTMLCTGDGDCGMNASCEGEGFMMGCAPACLQAP